MENREIVALLERGKARFVTERDLVKNWKVYGEDSSGKEYENLVGFLSHKNDKDICRLCMLGGVYIENSKKQIETTSIYWRAGEFIKNAAQDLFPERSFFLTDKYTLEEVHRVYDLAIRLAKGE